MNLFHRVFEATKKQNCWLPFLHHHHHPLFSYLFAKSLSNSLWRKARYLSTLVPAHCWQKLSSFGTSELRGNGPFRTFFNSTKNRCRGRILWSKDKLRYIGYLVKICTSFFSSLTKYMYFGFRLSSSERDKTYQDPFEMLSWEQIF